MAEGSRVCPYCRALNSAGAARCIRCEKKLPGPLLAGLVDGFHALLGREFPLTKLYIGICVAVFIAVMIEAGGIKDIGGRHVPLSTELRWGILIGAVVGVSEQLPIAFVEPWRYLSAMFFHFGVLHIAFNMLALLDFGRSTETRLGSARFTLIFVFTGVVGFIASDAWNILNALPMGRTAGASGGLFGLMGALIGFLFAKRDPAYKSYLLHAVVFTVVMIVIDFGVNHAAHIGGFAAGIPLGFIFYKENRPWKRDVLFGWLAALLVVCSVGSILLSHRSPLWQYERQREIQLGRSAPIGSPVAPAMI
jgi:membrane associated rhomboid family serine protease